MKTKRPERKDGCANRRDVDAVFRRPWNIGLAVCREERHGGDAPIPERIFGHILFSPEMGEPLQTLADFENDIISRALAGDTKAAVELAKFARDATRALAEVARRHPHLLRPMARAAADWPVIYSPHPDDKRAIETLWTELEIGTQASINKYSRAKWTSENVATRYAKAIINTIKVNQRLIPQLLRQRQEMNGRVTQEDGKNLKYVFLEPPKWALDCVTLPPFSKSTAPQWWGVGRQAIMEWAGGHPERHKELRSLGLHRSKQNRGEYLAGSAPHGATETNIREGIFKAIKQTFCNMAAREKSPKGQRS